LIWDILKWEKLFWEEKKYVWFLEYVSFYLLKWKHFITGWYSPPEV